MLADLKGRVNNMHLSKSDALLPLFEAVVNSIQAIDERKRNGFKENGKITITIHRSPHVTGQQDIETDSKSLPPIIGFSIEDNGIGFDKTNYESFNKTDSTYKEKLGGKGIGRLLWLKVFDSVHIDSVYEEQSTRYHREFDFILDEENNPNKGESVVETDKDIRTIIHLNYFKEEYRTETKAYKKRNTIAQKILDHCLSFFVAGSAPDIIVVDNDHMLNDEDVSENTTSLRALYSEFEKDIHTEVISVKKFDFKLIHLKLYKEQATKHYIAYCGNQRCVQELPLLKICGKQQFKDDKGSFYYSVYVSSQYFDDNVNQTRNGFDILDTRKLDDYGVSLLPLGHPAMDEIERKVVEAAEIYLSQYLAEVDNKKRELVATYISNVNPAFRRIYNKYEQAILKEINLGMKPETIASVLNKFRGIEESTALNRVNELLSTNENGKLDIDILSREIDGAIQDIDDSYKNGLASAVLYRYKILELLQKKIGLQPNGKYSPEKDIHEIIYPQKESSDTLTNREHNLWILDDRLEFHVFATSDIPFKKFSSSDSSLRPDVLVFKKDNENAVATSVTIVEFKRPGRDDEDVEDQIFDYLRELELQNVTTKDGIKIYTKKDQTVYYCYILCDFNEYRSAIVKITDKSDYKPLMGEIGYYRYNSRFNAHIEILSYQKIIADAKLRNKYLFEKLGLDYHRI